MRRHPLADAVDVERAAAHARRTRTGTNTQLDAELVARRHPAHERLRELVALVELDQQRIGQLARGEVVDRLQRDLQHLGVELVGHVNVPPLGARVHGSLWHRGRSAIGTFPADVCVELRTCESREPGVPSAT